jgi:hypothetical protein
MFMSARLLAGPLITALDALVAYALLAYWIPHELQASAIFQPLSVESKRYAPNVSGLLMVWTALQVLNVYFRYWKWTKGEGPTCKNCGMMAAVRDGRYGSYWKCVGNPGCGGRGRV